MIMLSTTQYAEYLEYREQERERVAHLPNTQVINPWGDNTRLYIFPKFDYLGQIQVPSQEIWIFSLRNVPACPMNCSQNYILHVCFHLNLKHANTRQLLVNPSFEFLTHRAYSNHHKNQKLSMLLFTRWSKRFDWSSIHVYCLSSMVNSLSKW